MVGEEPEDGVVQWATLRRNVYALHTFKLNIPPMPGCPWCNGSIRWTEDWHLHEVFKKRSSVHPSQQWRIFTVENCIAVHAECHLEHGQTQPFLVKAFARMMDCVGAMEVMDWYLKLCPHINEQVDFEYVPFESRAEDLLRKVFL